MAPATQKKGKKPAASTVSPKKRRQAHGELQEGVMKEPEAVSAPNEAAKIAVAQTTATEEGLPAVASKAADYATEERIDHEEIAAEEMEEDDTGPADEKLEEVEEEEEEAEDVENGTEEKAGEEDVAMRNEDAGETEGDHGKVNVAADGVSKSAQEDNFGPSSGKIFIGGLSRETTTEVLTRHFEKYGELTDSVIMKNRNTGQPRGFGFVTYADASIVDRVLEHTHIINGRTVDAKRTVPREKISAPIKGPKTKKIFVGGLTLTTKEDDLKAFFGKFGRITSCQIMQDHKVGKSRGFGFLTFDSEQVVEELLAQGKMHEIDGKQVEIKKAEPKTAGDPPFLDRSGYMGARQPVPGSGAGVSAYGTNPGFYGGFHAANVPMYSAEGYFNRVAGRPGGLAYGDTYGYGGGYGAPYGYGEYDEVYGGMNYNHAGYELGSGYGHSYGGGGGYDNSNHSYGSGRYHPYSR